MLPDGARIEKGSGGLDRLVLETPQATAHVYLHGAHVTHFQPVGGAPVLFLSARSQFVEGTPGKAIRGGVPICFPWFGAKGGDPSAPAHGFARLLPWELGQVVRSGAEGVGASLVLRENDLTRRWFPHAFEATLTVTIEASLRLELRVINKDAGAMTFEEALHSYFGVGDVRRASLRGLESARFIDKTRGFAETAAEGAPLVIAGETDRVYPHALGSVTIDDPIGARQIVVEKSRSASTVVWNPWVQKAKSMSDFGNDEWSQMVCVEAANVSDDRVTLQAGESHGMSVTATVRPR